MRLLGLARQDVAAYRDQVRHGDRRAMPGAVRASAGINTTENDVARLLTAVARIASGDTRTDPLPSGPPHGRLLPVRGCRRPASPSPLSPGSLLARIGTLAT